MPLYHVWREALDEAVFLCIEAPDAQTAAKLWAKAEDVAWGGLDDGVVVAVVEVILPGTSWVLSRGHDGFDAVPFTGPAPVEK